MSFYHQNWPPMHDPSMHGHAHCFLTSYECEGFLFNYVPIHPKIKIQSDVSDP